ncbi:hypothetical protein CMT56_07140 [Elizabethkingia anophelis]|nr:hypothetical protein BBD30_03050 [Elizabethkingia anophelis]MDV3856374.1 hypothetical protein [Elizabethkingia anophelis]MDV3863416.1 hypothetical protein [Elizabethkingia anophelis]MDV3910169.1 hypothetical protein [Elizabethkingia anophelis]MDV3923030.1 hypothetical protein [Elizabethkingia anophelis]
MTNKISNKLPFQAAYFIKYSIFILIQARRLHQRWEDHHALSKKNSKNKAYKNYENTMKQLIKIDKKYEKDAQIN